MIQWIGVIVTLVGLVYTGFKDVQNGIVKIPQISQNQPLTKQQYPIQYCLMAYDPNTDRIYYQHENGQWYDYAPQQRRYSTSPQYHQTQNQKAVGTVYGTQGGTVYGYGQPTQATAYPQRY